MKFLLALALVLVASPALTTSTLAAWSPGVGVPIPARFAPEPYTLKGGPNDWVAMKDGAILAVIHVRPFNIVADRWHCGVRTAGCEQNRDGTHIIWVASGMTDEAFQRVLREELAHSMGFRHGSGN